MILGRLRFLGVGPGGAARSPLAWLCSSCVTKSASLNGNPEYVDCLSSTGGPRRRVYCRVFDSNPPATPTRSTPTRRTSPARFRGLLPAALFKDPLSRSRRFTPKRCGSRRTSLGSTVCRRPATAIWPWEWAGWRPMHGCLKTSEAKPGGVSCGKVGDGQRLDRLPSHTPHHINKITNIRPQTLEMLGRSC